MSVSELDVEKVKDELLDPRTISLAVDPEGRRETVQAIWDSKSVATKANKAIGEREARIQEIQSLTAVSHQREYQLTTELGTRQASLAVKIKGFVGLADRQATLLQEEIEANAMTRLELYGKAQEITAELEALAQVQSELPDPREQLAAYYEKMATLPLTNEQKRELLKPEVLASLSMDEYTALWRRLNPHFLSHVTRQGFRDHNAMVYHSGGMEEFHNGFVSVLGDERALRPPLALNGLENRDEPTVKKFLSGWVFEAKSADEAKERLDKLLNFSLGAAPKYPDKTAIHFAAQIVANGYYGGEADNEVFFIFPSDVIASQHAFAFNGWEKDFTQPQSETKWNDVFVWPEGLDHPGIPVDSGIVFLPENTPVDQITGSKYASEVMYIEGQPKVTMVEDTRLVQVFRDWGRALDSQSPVRATYTNYREERDYYYKQEKEKSCREFIARELAGLGFTPEASYGLSARLMEELYWNETFTDEALESIVRSSGAHWKRAENTIPSKEYWERYFSQNPSLRPAHVHYYDGDPTYAVMQFQQTCGIGNANTSEKEGKLLGFEDNHVVDMGSDPRANAGFAELTEIAQKVIDDRYSNKL